MNSSRRRPSRVFVLALGLSALVHALLFPFARVPAAARPRPSQKPDLFYVSPLRPRPAPRPTPTPVRPAPRPIAAHPAAVRRARFVAVVPPRAHDVSPSGTSNATARTGGTASGDGAPVGDSPVSAGAQEPGVPDSTAVPAPEATLPQATAAPIQSTCPNQPHDATVTRAVTPDRPAGAVEEDAVGRVVVEVRLAQDGSVARASVHVSSGYASLDNAALEAAAHARYAPASDGCEAIGGTYLYVVDFSE